MRDSVGLSLLRLGSKPEDFTREQADAAFAEIQKAVDDGIIRSFLGNDFKEGLVKGDLVLGVAWSGDIIQAALEKETLRFVVPDEGGTLWTQTNSLSLRPGWWRRLLAPIVQRNLDAATRRSMLRAKALLEAELSGGPPAAP